MAHSNNPLRPYVLQDGKSWSDEATRHTEAGRRRNVHAENCVHCARLVPSPTHFVLLWDGGSTYEMQDNEIVWDTRLNESGYVKATGEEAHVLGIYEVGSTCAARLRKAGVRVTPLSKLNARRDADAAWCAAA